MVMHNTYIPNVVLSDVKYILVKDKNSDLLKKIPLQDVQGLTGTVIEIVQFMGRVIPSGLLLCDGKRYLRENYPKLSEVLGSFFSLPGDPPETFRVPDLVTGNRFLLSGDQINYKAASKDEDTKSPNYIYCEDNILNHTHSGMISLQCLDRYNSGCIGGFRRFTARETYERTTSYSGSDETAGKNMAVNFCIRTGPISEKGLERSTTDNEMRETTYSEIRIVASVD